MITPRLEMFALSLACLALAGGCDVPPQETASEITASEITASDMTASEMTADQAELTPGALPAVEGGEIRVSCQRFFVRRATYIAAELRLLPEQLDFPTGEAIDLRKDTPPGAADCRLILYANSGAE
jgi:hypothetical protein